ncbi:MAG: efflux RND transporter periplasmic adaptor subunit [Planctomycetaceae bacterium]|nr:efflux RND transporter periplasmic adaptor subunit [Planctomycetaceae bacterium]
MARGSLWVVCLVGLCSGCEPSKPPIAKPVAPEVLVATPIQKEVTEYVEFTGRTEAASAVDIRARVSGYLIDVPFVEGSDVKEGDLLYQIDPRPFEAEVERSQGEVARWQAQLSKATADLTRSKTLRQQNVLSQEELDASIAQEGIAKASLMSAEAALKQAKLNLEFTRITAPIAGRVSRTSITKGNLVSTGSADSGVLTTVVAQHPMYVLFDVDERTMLRHRAYLREKNDANQIAELKARRIPAYVGLANQTGFPYRGVLDFGDNRLDPTTGTIKVRAVLDNDEHVFTPGMFARVKLPFGDPHSALLVPSRAIGVDQGQRFVLVVNAENVVEVRPVTLGMEEEQLRVVESGVSATDRVIVAGMQNVRPGITVQPRTASQAEPKAAEKTPPAEQSPSAPAATHDKPPTKGE